LGLLKVSARLLNEDGLILYSLSGFTEERNVSVNRRTAPWLPQT
jgi:hypothetical protein